MNDITKKAKEIYEDIKDKVSDTKDKANNEMHEFKGEVKNEKRHIEDCRINWSLNWRIRNGAIRWPRRYRI